MNDKPDARSWRNPNAVAGEGAARIAACLTLGQGLRRKTEAGLALGSFIIDCPTPGTVHALALAGFDFVVLDMEHSPLDSAGLNC